MTPGSQLKEDLQGWRDGQWLGAFPALPEDLSLVLSTHAEVPRYLLQLQLRGIHCPLLVSAGTHPFQMWHLIAETQTYTDTDTDTHAH